MGGEVCPSLAGRLASLDGQRIPLSSEERSYRQGSYPYYGASGVIDEVDDYLFDEPLVLVSEDGANLVLRSSPIAFVATGRYWVNNHAHVLRPLAGPAAFWAHRLEVEDVAPLVSGSAQPKLTASALMRMPIAAPESVEEQNAIVRYLDHETAQIDTLIAEQEHLIELLRERRATVVDRVVWGGLDEAAPTSPTGIDPVPVAPTHWRRLRNKNLLFESADLSGGGEVLLSVSHLTGITPRAEKSVTMAESEDLSGYRRVRAGELVVNTMWAWMGALGVSRVEGIVSPAYGVYRPLDGAEFDAAYFDYLYRSRPYVVEMTRHSRGIWSSRLRIYPEVFLSLTIVVPPLAEQAAIASHLDEQTSKIGALIAEAERFIDLARERRSALIAAAVTGQIDVGGAA